MLSGSLDDFIKNNFFEFSILADFFETVEGDLVCLTPGLSDGLLGDDNADHIVLERITVDERLGDRGTEDKDVFNLLWSDVFSLRKFEDVLRPVDDFQ
jgi:hypothetical protein